MATKTLPVENVSRETAEIVETSCRRCESTLDTTGSPRWCRDCRAKYQREYKALLKDMSETRGFAAGFTAGAESMRAKIVGYCGSLGNGKFAGILMARWISKLPNPSPKS